MEENKEHKDKFAVLTPDQKCQAVSHSPEVKNCIKLLYALYEDLELKSFIRYKIEIDGKEFELAFQEVRKGTCA